MAELKSSNQLAKLKESPEENESSSISTMELLIKLKGFDLLCAEGHGGFGIVYSVFHRESQSVMAAKVVEHSTFGEDCLWPKLCHPNIMELWSVLPLVNRSKVFFMPYMTNDLYKLIYKPHFVLCPRAFERKRHYLIDIVKGLEYLHGRSLCHLDLKCENIMISDDDRAIICDFSTLTDVSQEDAVCRFGLGDLYLPPEVSRRGFRSDGHAKSAEMWTFGIMILQLFLMHLLDCKFKFRPLPDVKISEFFSEIKRRENTDKILRRLHPRVQLRSADIEEFIDFVFQFIRMNPWDRMTAAEARKHTFLKDRGLEADSENRSSEHDWNLSRTQQCAKVDTDTETELEKNTDGYSQSTAAADCFTNEDFEYLQNVQATGVFMHGLCSSSDVKRWVSGMSFVRNRYVIPETGTSASDESSTEDRLTQPDGRKAVENNIQILTGRISAHASKSIGNCTERDRDQMIGQFTKQGNMSTPLLSVVRTASSTDLKEIDIELTSSHDGNFVIHPDSVLNTASALGTSAIGFDQISQEANFECL